ncbi:hypothetical protein AVEN_123383-1 [Araneus ventricosus]|uniref:Uncharacterized protein n=1 Tax=Araneus ventricosus TaxID=182803 RepID=A0A4Y2RJ55_ARAVE|nr:hypothetical protein AVEN_123383-1 [Araneus ventricosus]
MPQKVPFQDYRDLQGSRDQGYQISRGVQMGYRDLQRGGAKVIRPQRGQRLGYRTDLQRARESGLSDLRRVATKIIRRTPEVSTKVIRPQRSQD